MSHHPPPPPRASGKSKSSFRTLDPNDASRSDRELEQSAVVYRAVDFEHSAHLDAHGNILAGNGRVDDLASLAAYACRLASLVGRQLSFGDLKGMETTLSTGTYFVHREDNGELVCIKPRPHLNLIQLRTQLNL